SMDRKILVVVTGEFGQTPRLSQTKDGAGRDHRPDAYSALVAGAGLRRGQAVGPPIPGGVPIGEALLPEGPAGDGLPPPGDRLPPNLYRPRRPDRTHPRRGPPD